MENPVPKIAINCWTSVGASVVQSRSTYPLLKGKTRPESMIDKTVPFVCVISPRWWITGIHDYRILLARYLLPLSLFPLIVCIAPFYSIDWGFSLAFNLVLTISHHHIEIEAAKICPARKRWKFIFNFKLITIINLAHFGDGWKNKICLSTNHANWSQQRTNDRNKGKFSLLKRKRDRTKQSETPIKIRVEVLKNHH